MKVNRLETQQTNKIIQIRNFGKQYKNCGASGNGTIILNIIVRNNCRYKNAKEDS